MIKAGSSRAVGAVQEACERVYTAVGCSPWREPFLTNATTI